MPQHGNVPSGGRTDAVVIGAGHSGLAMSHCLDERSIDHVVLERGEVANSWRHERWDSLRLLTPNWLSSLPGLAYDGDDAEGYMTMPEVIDFIDRYARIVAAPLATRTNVTSLTARDGGYTVTTEHGELQCRSVVVASGACNLPSVPAVGESLPAGIESLTPDRYRNPGQLAPGAVLIVGASATGLQVGDELLRSGRDVTIAVGEHVRMPRVYRGRDVQFWMQASGLLDERYDEVEDIVRARRLPSPQLVGSRAHRTLDLNALVDRGARLVGRLMALRGDTALFSGSLRNVCALADLKMGRLLDTFDEWARETGRDAEFKPPERFATTRIEGAPVLQLNLPREGFRTVLWATGFKPDYSWLDLPVFDRKGQVRHDGGIGTLPGLYIIGLPFLRRRKSSFIHGAEDDARDLARHMAGYL
jgi:putative flavoprotein involved in K+ transport